MSGSVGAPRHEPVPIGQIAEPPFVRLPDPTTLFALRAHRFHSLATEHQLGPYLNFLGQLSGIQHNLQDGLPEPDMPADAVLVRAREHAMPPLDRTRFTADEAYDTTLARLFAQSKDMEMPDAARAALERAATASEGQRAAMASAVLSDRVPVEALADHIYVAAALQVHFARMAARLEPKKLVPVGDGACPCCGGPPVASLVVGWEGAHNTRYCVCSLCATSWNYVRIKCTLCGETGGIGYQHVEHDKQIRAETCDKCHGYVKIMQQVANPALDPVADDVASLALDLLVREGGYRRGAVNAFMLGY
ncbi:formate dehydrogenase accessory protein FdhE [Pseudolabrys sp. FHR47]|uniref:formate dehydrogenase accessory protein FdhE n=1 Tax=Pseudolabrys sp. FHR47 TaxID=2562284 RepID=UPI0010BE6D80|nr:formate dehydrogenase accessory protein FdhE [Pseudolabrys sp. FHR47]